MPDLTAKSNKTKYIVIAIALALAGIGYLGYRSLLVKPQINEVRTGRRGRDDNSQGAGFRWGGEQEVKTQKVTQPRDNTSTGGSGERRINKRRGGGD